MTSVEPQPEPARSSSEDTLEVEIPPELLRLVEYQDDGPGRDQSPRQREAGAESGWGRGREYAQPAGPGHPEDDLLDAVGSWPVTSTPVGAFQLVPVRLERDLAMIADWMNDPAVAAYWELNGGPGRTHRHVEAQLTGDGRSVPCLGVLDGVPMSYWEIYRADLDPLARYVPVRPHDTGLHLLLGPSSCRGRRLGTALLRAVAGLVLDHRPACRRVLAEPDLRNVPSLAAFLSAGFRLLDEVQLPSKRAAIMTCDRRLRDLL